MKEGEKKQRKILLLLHQNILFSSRYLITTASAVSGRRNEIHKGKSGEGQKRIIPQ
jgi:hypothetical protein